MLVFEDPPDERVRTEEDVKDAPDAWTWEEEDDGRSPLTERERREMLRHGYVEAMHLLYACGSHNAPDDARCFGYCASCIAGYTYPNQRRYTDNVARSDISVHMTFRMSANWRDWRGGSRVRLLVSGF